MRGLRYLLKLIKRFESINIFYIIFMENDKNSLVLIIVAVIVSLAVGGAAGFFYGNDAGYKKGDSAGYKRAEADMKNLQEASAKKVSEEAAKAANPFGSSNPLEGVEANPFEKAKQVLNPFE